MADLLVSGGDTERPWQRVQPDPDGAPVGALSGSAATSSLLAPDSPYDGPSDGGADRADGAGLDPYGDPGDDLGAARGIAIADVPDWVVERVDLVTYPTRMARRRALEQAQVSNGWQPDPLITPPVLNQVEDELSRVLGRRYEPSVQPEPQPEPHAQAQADAEPESQRQLDIPAQTGRPSSSRSTRPDLLPSVARSQRGARRRSQRRRVVVIAGAVAAVLVAVAAFVVLNNGASGKPDASTASAAPTQQVVALALSSGDQLTGLSLLAAGEGGAQQVLVPSRLLLDVPGAGRLPVSRSLAPGASAPGAAIADALDIRVAGTWVLSTSALATLVDSVGGVSVDVDVDVPKGAGEGAAILASAGDDQRLNGSQAAAYAQLLVGDEPEAVRLARQERVVTAVLAALPEDAARRRAFLVGLPGAPTSDVLNAVVAVTGGLHEAAASNALPSTVLPVRDIDTGGDITAYGLDDKAAADVVAGRLAGAMVPVPAGGRLIVLVQNGVGSPGLGDTARSKLVASGLKYKGGGNVDGFGVKQSVVLIPDGSSGSRAKGLTVARSLGLNGSALRLSDTMPSVADVVVVLGEDFDRH